MSDLSTPRPRAAAAERQLYHVLHPTDTDADFWTADYIVAVKFYEQFVHKYGAAHLHVECLHAGQYEAECLLSPSAEGAA